MSSQHPIEIVFRCFVSYLDFMTPGEISRMDEQMPHENTIREWVKKGEGTEGYPWDKIREITMAFRAEVELERQIGDRALQPWQEIVREISQDLVDARDKVMEHIKAGAMKQPGVKDLVDIIKAEGWIRGEATTRVEVLQNQTRLLGQIIQRRIHQELRSNPHLAERIIDLIAQDFKAARATGGDEKKMKELTG